MERKNPFWYLIIFPNILWVFFTWRKLENFLILSTSSHLHLLCYCLSLHSELLDTFSFHLFMYSLNHRLRVVHDGWVLCEESSTMVWLFWTVRTVQNQNCLLCPSPAEQCVMGNAMTGLELICNWSYFEHICCLLLCWCLRNLEQHSRNKFKSYFVFSECLLPKDVA